MINKIDLNKNTGIAFYNDTEEIMDLLVKENPTAYRLFFLMTRNMNKNNILISDIDFFQKELNMSKSTIYRSLRYLKDKNILTIEKTGINNVYKLNKDFVFINKIKKKK